MIAVYARVSTEEQAKHGFSLADQLRECKTKAGTSQVLEYTDEGISGEFLDRPALNKLRGDVASGLVTKVICLDPDRLSRKLMNQLILSDEFESKAELEFVNGEYARTPEGQLFYQMRGAISQFEKAKINERMSRGRREKARQGRVLRDFHIYGYDYNSETEEFVVNEREARIVKLIFELFTEPKGLVKGINGIAQYLNDHAIPSKKGGRFHRQVIRQMLMNRAYIGEFYQNKWNTEGMLGNKYRRPEDRVPQQLRPKSEWIQLPILPIVEQKVFDYAQSLLYKSRRLWAGKSFQTYLLSGLLRCADCGNTMVGRRKKNWGKETFVYSDVKNTAGAKNRGCGNTLQCDKFDEQIWNQIVKWALEKQPDENSLMGSAAESFEDRQREDLREELSRIETGIDRLLSLMADPDIDVEPIREKVKQYQDRKREVMHSLASLEDAVENQANDNPIDIRVKISEALHAMSVMDPTELAPDLRRELLRTVVREIRVDRGGNLVNVYTF